MNEESLDLLDLDDTDAVAEDSLPEATPFVAPRPHRPWLLMGIGLAVIVLAVFIIIKVVGNNSSSSIEVDLGTPVTVEEKAVEVVDADVQPTPVVPAPGPIEDRRPVMPPPPAPVAEPAPMSAPVVAQPMVQDQSSVRIVQDRKEVKFQPEKVTETPKPIVKPAPKKVKTATKPKPAPKTATKTSQKVANGGWYVQFGSYSTREAADAAGKKIRAEHPSLFSGKQFVVLAAVLPSGQTTYRLRVAFSTSNDANGFCRNAKSDGVDCYVAK